MLAVVRTALGEGGPVLRGSRGLKFVTDQAGKIVSDVQELCETLLYEMQGCIEKAQKDQAKLASDSRLRLSQSPRAFVEALRWDCLLYTSDAADE